MALLTGLPGRLHLPARAWPLRSALSATPSNGGDRRDGPRAEARVEVLVRRASAWDTLLGTLGLEFVSRLRQLPALVLVTGNEYVKYLQMMMFLPP